MRKNTIKIILLFIITILTLKAEAQIFIKSEYFGQSKYNDEDGERANGKGSAYVIQAGAQLPISMKADTLIKGTDTIPCQIVWGIRADGSYTRLENTNMEQYQFPSEILNVRLGIIHLRTINKNWSLYASAGAGLYSSPNHISSDKIVGEGALIFIRNILPNLKIGAGIAFDNTFGFPMVYPGIIVDWAVDGKNGKYFVRLNTNEIKAGAKINESFKISAHLQASGALALEKERIFTHLYYTAGVTPEFKLGKYFTVPVTVGVATARNAYAHKRTVTDLFSYLSKENLPHFGISPYISVGLNYGL